MYWRGANFSRNLVHFTSITSQFAVKRKNFNKITHILKMSTSLFEYKNYPAFSLFSLLICSDCFSPPLNKHTIVYMFSKFYWSRYQKDKKYTQEQQHVLRKLELFLISEVKSFYHRLSQIISPDFKKQ